MHELIHEYFTAVLEISAVVSIIVILLRLFSGILNRYYAAKCRYFICIILAVQLIIPFKLYLPEPVPPAIQVNIPSVSISDVIITAAHADTPKNVPAKPQDNVLNPTEAAISPADKIQTNDTMPQSSITQQTSMTLDRLISIVWLIGMAVFILTQFTGYLVFKRQVWRWNQPIDCPKTLSSIETATKQMRISKQIPCFINKIITSPMLIGLINPVMLLPQRNYSAEELSFILRHELIHYKRHDLLYKLLLTAANAVHWFNPIIYLLAHEANQDLELSCDEDVIKGRTADERKAYSETILASIHFGKMKNSIFTTNFNGGTKVMKKRLANIFDSKKKRNGRLMAAAVAAAVLMSCFLVGFNITEMSTVNAGLVSEIENIKLTVTDCNVYVKTLSKNVVNSDTDNNGFKYEIDESIYTLTISQDNETLNIELKPTGRRNENQTAMPVIYIPEKEYNNITVTGNRAGISLPPVNADFIVTNSDGATSMSVSKQFNKTIDFSNISGSGSLIISPAADNYTLNMKAAESAVSVPPEMPDYLFEPGYEYVKGDGSAKINLEIKESSFSILVSDVNDYKMDTITIKDKVFYIVDSEEQLRLIGSDNYPLSGNYMLNRDIELTDLWTPLGTGDETPFTGIFNGNGFTIKNITIDNKNKAYKYIGFFGLVKGGTVHNVALENVNIKTDRTKDVSIAPIAAAVIDNGKVTDCTVK